MADLNIYQIVLIVVLLLNLLVWFVVICIRLFCTTNYRNRRSNNFQTYLTRRRRLRLRSGNDARRQGIRNPAFLSHQDENYDNRLYSISEELDIPPTYEEAIRYPVCRHPVYMQPELQHSSTRPFPDQRPVVLSVSEEPTTPAQIRTQTVSNTVQPPQSRQEFLEQDSTSQNNNGQDLPLDDGIGEMPLVFTIDQIGLQTSKILNVTDTTIKLTDGQYLLTHSKV